MSKSEMSKSPIEIGVDVGGTFTDFLLIDQNGDVRIGKHLSTGDNPSRGVIDGASDTLAAADLNFKDLQRFVHGTTVATNTILTRCGARVGMLTTCGFRDTLDIMEKVKYDIYDLLIEYPTPLIPRHLRREITERVTKDGQILSAPEMAEVKQAVDELVAEGVEAILICFLHSYKYPKHEQQVAEFVKSQYNNLIVGCSSEICPDMGEFMRFSTSAINMYIRPRMERYLDDLENTLRQRDLKCNCYLMLSTGATADFKTAGLLPVRLIESGPAAGAIAAAYYGKLTNTQNMVAFDMGGTTAKACVIENFKPALNYDHFEVARVHRFKKGSGMPLKAPSIDMIEIGAGGGSIARKDELGFLKVGPESAESNPGPVCYDLGGVEPTVTDANLVLGYLDPSYFLGGKMRLNKELAWEAIGRLASSLDIDPVRAAWGIHDVVSESMASAARTHLLEKGRDSRRYSLFAFGGSGPVHACRVAEHLGMSSVICALGAGTLSALGLLLAPMAFDFSYNDASLLSEIDQDVINRFLASSSEKGLNQLRDAGVDPSKVEFTRFVELRYAGQGYEVGVSLPFVAIDETSPALIEELFNAEYERLYGRTDPDNDIEVVKWRLVASGPASDIRIANSFISKSGSDPVKGSRSVYFPEVGGYVETKVYDRYSLRPGDVITGPAIVEEKESTAILLPNWRGRVDEFLNLVMERQESDLLRGESGKNDDFRNLVVEGQGPDTSAA